ncbi:hypothetical protein TorRG33x02_335380, partial [Trema orientale]
ELNLVLRRHSGVPPTDTWHPSANSPGSGAPTPFFGTAAPPARNKNTYSYMALPPPPSLVERDQLANHCTLEAN